MNLTKWFNFDYLMQNIKKSRLIIAIFTLIVPLFTTITLIATQDQVYDFINLSIVNVIGMYIVPFIFSLCLFGYVYKKNSVDFMCSMPLSRETVFTTNTVGGILLILITQLLTLICTFIVSSFSSSLIFPGLVWDVFLYQFIGYIFVFAVSNIAMSLSGNAMTQIVVTLLITFILPTVAVYLTQEGDISNELTNNIRIYQEIEPTYTAPANIFGLEYAFKSTSIIKMLILSCIYIVLGFVFFKKRKMEMATESFIKPNMHLFIKSLTLVPFIIISLFIKEFSSDGWVIFWIAMIVVYWFLYDLVTNKKIKFLKNISVLLIACIVLIGVLKLLVYAMNKTFKSYDESDITKIELESQDGKYVYKITDKELISEIAEYKYGADDDCSLLDGTLSVGLNKFKADVTLNEELLAKVRKYAEPYQEKEEKSDVRIIISSQIANNEQKEKIEEMLRNTECTESVYGTYYARYVNNLFSAYSYKNHTLYRYEYNLNDNIELRKYVNELSNSAVVSFLSESTNKRGSYLDCTVKNEGNAILGYPDISIEEIKKFIQSNKEESVDYSKSYVKIYVYDYYNQFYAYFITNKVEEVVNILKQYDEYVLGQIKSEEDYYYEKYGETVEASDKTIDSYDVSGNLIENEVIE